MKVMIRRFDNEFFIIFALSFRTEEALSRLQILALKESSHLLGQDEL